MENELENDNSFSSYNNIKRLSDEEIEKVWEEYLNDHDNKELRDILIVQYIYLTRYVVGRVKVALPPTFTFEDISGYGIEGLIDAVEKYSPKNGARFETYALVRIRGTIIDKIRSQDFLPRTIRRKIRDVKSAQEQLKQKFGRPATNTEVAELLGMEPEKIIQILADDSTVTSLYDKRGSADDSLEIIDTIKDTTAKTPHEEFENKNIRLQLENALKRLPERERMIMVLYYHENMTFKEIGDTVGISESRICQIHAQAIMKLKNLLSENRSERMRQSIIIPD